MVPTLIIYKNLNELFNDCGNIIINKNLNFYLIIPGI